MEDARRPLPTGAQRALTVASLREELLLRAVRAGGSGGGAAPLPRGGGGGLRGAGAPAARGEGGSDPAPALGGSVAAAHVLERVAQRVACALEHRLATWAAAGYGAGAPGAGAALVPVEDWSRALEEEPAGEGALRYRRAARRAVGLFSDAGEEAGAAGGGSAPGSHASAAHRVLATLRRGVGKDAPLLRGAAALQKAAAGAAGDAERRALVEQERELTLEALRALPAAWPEAGLLPAGGAEAWWGSV
jgi:hypothetical protein